MPSFIIPDASPRVRLTSWITTCSSKLSCVSPQSLIRSSLVKVSSRFEKFQRPCALVGALLPVLKFSLVWSQTLPSRFVYRLLSFPTSSFQWATMASKIVSLFGYTKPCPPGTDLKITLSFERIFKMSSSVSLATTTSSSFPKNTKSFVDASLLGGCDLFLPSRRSQKACQRCS